MRVSSRSQRAVLLAATIFGSLEALSRMLRTSRAGARGRVLDRASKLPHSPSAERNDEGWSGLSYDCHLADVASFYKGVRLDGPEPPRDLWHRHKLSFRAFAGWLQATAFLWLGVLSVLIVMGAIAASAAFLRWRMR